MAARPAARRFDPAKVRVALLGVFLIAAWAALGYQLFRVQLVQAAELGEQGQVQRTAVKELAPDRGTIFDRNGDPLAVTVESQTLVADPRLVSDPVFTAQQVSAITGAPAGPMRDRIANGQAFAYLARQVDPDVAKQVLDLGLPGVYSIPEPKRVYPAGTVAAQAVGLVDIEGHGQEGLERVYDDLLSGTPGQVVYDRANKGGIEIPQTERDIVPAVPGDDLVTTLDLALQYTASDECAKRVTETSAEGCWIVVLNAKTGEVLAMAGAPGFDPVARQVVAPTEGGPTGFDNFAVRGTYEPGSTEKLITIASALDTGIVDINTVIPSVGDRYESTPGACASNDDDIYGCFNDSSPHAPRDMTVQEIFTISSNVGTIMVQDRLQQHTLEDYIQRFGLGQKTGIDFNGEASGSFNLDPTCSSCRDSAAIGYSVAVSPLQMAAAYAAIANDGVWTEPFLVASRVDVDGNTVPFHPETRQVVSEVTAWRMRQLLRDVVNDGTGTHAQIPGYTVGGKTGTAYKRGEDGTYTDKTMASFIGMAPVDDPQIVVAVVIDSPAYEFRYGGDAAAPVFAAVMEAALNRLGVVPDAVVR